MGFEATILLDSINPVGDRLTTWRLTYPRLVHSEMLTHRAFSRNAASSRAIPVEKFIEQVERDPAMPVWWGANQTGMQARAEVDDIEGAKAAWLAARNDAVRNARNMLAKGLHKQLVNRCLEQFQWMTVVASATDHGNFFELRDHPDAQPEIAHLAKLMRTAYDSSRPRRLDAGDWHIPLLRDDESDKPLDWKLAVATGRLAGVSYLRLGTDRPAEKEIELHERLRTSRPIHASPFEHCAEALSWSGRCGNFRGFRQYRHMYDPSHKEEEGV